MFITILILIVSLMHGYLFWRIGSLPWFCSSSRRKTLWRTALLIWVLFILGSVLGHGGEGWLSMVMERLAMDWLGILFITSMMILAVDLFTAFGFWAKTYLSWLRSGGLILAVVFIMIAMLQGLRPPIVVRHDVLLSELPPELDGTTLAVLSDLHLGSQLGARWLADRVVQVQALQPDLIVLLGDNFEGHGEPDPALLPVLSELRAPLGVFAVTGNHEHFSDISADVALTERAGIQWLRDRWLQIRPGLILAGVDDLTMHWRNGQPEDFVTPVLAGRPQGATVLFSHSPLQVEQAAAAGADLMLSGHTHGGQIWPFGYIVQHFYTYLVGRYEVNDMSLIISRGAGLWGPRMRLWQPAEIIFITLYVNVEAGK
ncbi:MAG: metallophosphoesterase [Gammaproteobacteria bacterium]|nr:metallophosphoesterase [Gammaproteobacteria bacterium]